MKSDSNAIPTSAATSAEARSKSTERPAKPDDDFPLYAHPLGYWSKKINNKITHFGRWGRIKNGKLQTLPYEESWKEALESYRKHEKDARKGLLEGVVVLRDDTRPLTPEEVDIRTVCNDFYNAKLEARNAGKLSISSMDEYRMITDLIVEQFGGRTLVKNITAKDFAALRSHMSSRWGEARLKNAITRVKTVFKFAYEMELIPKPIPCLQPHSSIFYPPSEAEIRKEQKKHEKRHGKNLFTAQECRTLIEGTPIPLKAMILLGLNCGFGNMDVATLHLGAMDLENGWIEYARTKTAVDRRCPLWAETIDALRDVVAIRPKPANKAYADTVFLRPNGKTWIYREKASAVTVAASKAIKDAKIHREKIGFYTLRRTFRTVADATLDHVAIRLIMGHTDGSIDAVYRKSIEDSRLLKVTNHVRDWLFAGQKGGDQ